MGAHRSLTCDWIKLKTILYVESSCLKNQHTVINTVEKKHVCSFGNMNTDKLNQTRTDS